MTTNSDARGKGIEALKEKYRAERDKRLAAGGRELVELTGPLGHYLDDPRLDPESPAATRAPVNDEIEVVGAGIGGLMVGVRLRKQGVTNVRLIDMAGDVGEDHS